MVFVLRTHAAAEQIAFSGKEVILKDTTKCRLLEIDNFLAGNFPVIPSICVLCLCLPSTSVYPLPLFQLQYVSMLADLPEHIQLGVLRFITRHDVLAVTSTCSDLRELFFLPSMWKELWFKIPIYQVRRSPDEFSLAVQRLLPCVRRVEIVGDDDNTTVSAINLFVINLPLLSHLRLRVVNETYIYDAVSIVQQCHLLKSFEMNLTWNGDECMNALVSRHHSTLEHLDISDATVTYVSLRGIDNLSRLKTLKLDINSQHPSDALPRSNASVTLNLIGKWVHESIFVRFFRTSHWAGVLTHLSFICENGASSSSIINRCPNLTHLEIMYMGVTPGDIDLVGLNINRLANLQYLRVICNPVHQLTDATLGHALLLPVLNSLIVENTQLITGNFLSSRPPRLPMLSVDLRNCPAVGRDIVRRHVQISVGGLCAKVGNVNIHYQPLWVNPVPFVRRRGLRPRVHRITPYPQ